MRKEAVALKYAWIEEYCIAKPGVIKDYKEEWAAYRYMVGGKMFAMQGGDKYGKPIITVKLEPTYGELLRNEYTDIMPGYYMNKQHWSSLYLEGEVPDEILKDMLDKSYALIFGTLSKKDRQEALSAEQ